MFGLFLGLILAIPKIVAAGPSEWLIWGGVACTGVAIVTIFTPAAPVAGVLGGVEAVGIVAGTMLHPAVRGVVVANVVYERSAEKSMLAEFLLIDLAPLPIPNDEYAPYFVRANVIIERHNIFRRHLLAGCDNPTLSLDLMDISAAIGELADAIEQSGFDTTISAADMRDALQSIETQGLPAFELEHLTRSGFSPGAIEEFAALHGTESPDGDEIQATSLSGAVRTVATNFREISLEIMGDTDIAPTNMLIEVICN